MSELYPDTNGNGVPDAFENRPPISDILNSDKPWLETSPHVEATDDDAYKVFVPREGGAILLEVRRVVTGNWGACLFRTNDELDSFIEKLRDAAATAFSE